MEGYQLGKDSVNQNFTRALNEIVAQVKDDRSILAAILCGSLSYDAVWEKSDVDLVFITLDDEKAAHGCISLYANGLNVHALLMSRTEFRHTVESAIGHSFTHSFLAKGRLLYSHDPTIYKLFERLGQLGTRDTEVQLLRAATSALPCIYKAHKFFITRGDLNYTALWILASATPLAQIEVISAHQLVDREVIPQALQLNSSFFTTIYSDMLNCKKTKKNVLTALNALDGYVTERAANWFAPLLEHLREVGEARSCTEIEDHFKRNYDVEGLTTACEYLADQGLLGKAGTAARLTKKSKIDVQELAFFALVS